MIFAIGYQLPSDDDSTLALVRDYREQVGEVYFAWPGHASGRASVGNQGGYVEWGAQAQLEEDLRELGELGVRRDLLFNANCYGGRALSVDLANEIASLLEHLAERVGGVEVVTTTSPVIAGIVKQVDPSIEVRASVNMRIGSPEAMRFLADRYDSFYLQRDRQRNLDQVRHAADWCTANGKQLYLLANSGCLHECPGQTFHDNLVAHDAEIDRHANLPDCDPHVCWRWLRDQDNWSAILQASWIRPEDLHHYDDLVPMVKLATRMHTRPRLVLHAYANRRYPGNLVDLLEPGFGPALAPAILANDRFPEDFFATVSSCDHRCTSCGYCERALQQILVSDDVCPVTEDANEQPMT